MEKLSLHKLVSQAWNFSRTKKFPWIFGALVALSGLIGSRINITSAPITSLEELFQTITTKSPEELTYLLLTLFVLFIASTFGKGNLIVALSFVIKKDFLPNHPTTYQALWKNFIHAFFIECIAFCFLAIIGGILSLPLLIASRTNAGAVPTLINFAFLTFILISIAVFLIKQFTLFYTLLFSLNIRGAVETSVFIFSRFFSLSLLFALFTFLLTALFTFCVNIVILGIVVLSEKISLPLGGTVFSFAISFILFTWFVVFEQTLWLLFFKSIAKQEEKEKGEKERVLNNDVLPETPPAQ